MRLWFANFIMYSAALTVAGCYVPFTDIGSAVMKMLADTQHITIDDSDKNELKEKFSTRVGNDVLGVGPQPHIVGNDLNGVADQLIARHRGQGQ
jgi:hypothetical protein